MKPASTIPDSRCIFAGASPQEYSMTTDVTRSHTRCEGLQDATRPLEPVRRGSLRGGGARGGRPARGRRPAGVPDRAAYRPLAERQVHRPGAVERAALAWGGQPADRTGAVRRAASRHARVAQLAPSCSSRTASPAPTRRYRLPVRVITEYAWHSLFARNCSSSTGRGRPTPPAVHDHRRAELQGRPGAARHATPKWSSH